VAGAFDELKRLRTSASLGKTVGPIAAS